MQQKLNVTNTWNYRLGDYKFNDVTLVVQYQKVSQSITNILKLNEWTKPKCPITGEHLSKHKVALFCPKNSDNDYSNCRSGSRLKVSPSSEAKNAGVKTNLLYTSKGTFAKTHVLHWQWSSTPAMRHGI